MPSVNRSSSTFYQTNFAQNFGVAKDDDTIFRTRESDVETSGIVQETNALMLITSNAAENNVILLSSLESVHTGHFDFFIKILLERTIELHIVHNVGTLAFVWRNNTDLARNDSRLEEFCHNLFNVRSLRPS